MSDDEELGEELPGEEDTDYIGEYDGDRNELEERHGNGKAILPNHDVYEGQYRKGLRYGQGIYKYKKGRGARYEGQWYNGKKHGYGVFYYPDGSRYEGFWDSNIRTGFGTYYYPNGDIYEGFWERDKKNGKGLYIHKNNDGRYIGDWKDNIQMGEAMCIYLGKRYLGHFCNDKPVGPGRYMFPSIECQQLGVYTQCPADEEGAEEGGVRTEISAFPTQPPPPPPSDVNKEGGEEAVPEYQELQLVEVNAYWNVTGIEWLSPEFEFPPDRVDPGLPPAFPVTPIVYEEPLDGDAVYAPVPTPVIDLDMFATQELENEELIINKMGEEQGKVKGGAGEAGGE